MDIKRKSEKVGLKLNIHGEGDGTPLQYSSLENPMDGGAWWAAVYGVAGKASLLCPFPHLQS